MLYYENVGDAQGCAPYERKFEGKVNMNYKEYTIDKITEITGLERDTVAGLVETPPEQKLGDLAFPCFVLAKTLRKAPPIIAKELSEKFSGGHAYK